MPDTTRLPVKSLEPCERTRARARKPGPNEDIISEYAEAYASGLIVEPLDVFREAGTERYVIADGEHRWLALQRANLKQADCRVHQGDELDALDFAVGCNHSHGRRLTQADRVHAFERIMDTELKERHRTDSQLAEKLGVSRKSIQRYRAEWREKVGGDAKAKAKAKAHAEKYTPKRGHVSTSEETPEESTRSPNRHHFKGAKARNLQDLENSIGTLSRFPMDAKSAVEMCEEVTDFDWDKAQDAYEWLAELLNHHEQS